MTRQEFIDNVRSFYDLISFCNEEDLDVCCDILDEEDANQEIMMRLRDFDTWLDVRRFIDEIPDCDYYREDDWGDFEAAEDYFEDYKEEALRIMDEDDRWDEDEEVYFIEEDVEQKQTVTTVGDYFDPDDEEDEISTDALFEVLSKAG